MVVVLTRFYGCPLPSPTCCTSPRSVAAVGALLVYRGDIRYFPGGAAQVHSFVLQGIDPLACEVEVGVCEGGLPRTTVVGNLKPKCANTPSVECNG